MKTALIGLGRIGWQYHLPQIVKHEGFELAAGCGHESGAPAGG